MTQLSMASRQQARDFAHQLDATSYILRRLNFPLNKLRDVVDGLQGAGGGRLEYDLSHLALARRLRHIGKDDSAEAYARRKVAALAKAQRESGRLLFTIIAGGGVEHKRTHYVDHITPVANWMMQRARESELWKEHPGKAIESFVESAIEKLPAAQSDHHNQQEQLPLEDNLYIQRMIAQSINYLVKAYERASITGHDGLGVVEMAIERVRRYVSQRHAESENEEWVTDLSLIAGSRTTAEQSSTLKAAINLVTDKGLPVFPVKKDKTPLTPNGFKNATTDLSVIRRWWSKHPDAGIAVPTGEASGWLVLDIDPRHGGDVSLSELIDVYGPPPETLEAETGGGGLHIIFAYPPQSTIKNSTGKLGAGLDVRGEGGYIVVPPSVHASGTRYRWRNDATPYPPPDWLLILLSKEDSTPNSSRSRAASNIALQIDSEVFIEGERNQRLFVIACSMRGKGAEKDEIKLELLNVNIARCSPPLAEAEIEKISKSASRYPVNTIRQKALQNGYNV